MMLNKKVSPLIGYLVLAIAVLAFLGLNWIVQLKAQEKVAEIITNVGSFSTGNISGPTK